MKQGLIGLLLITVASGAAIGLRPRLQAWTTPTPNITEASLRVQRVFAVGIVEGRSSSVGTRFETAGRVTEVLWILRSCNIAETWLKQSLTTPSQNWRPPITRITKS